MATWQLHQFLLGRGKLKCLKCRSTNLSRYGQLLQWSATLPGTVPDISRWSYEDKAMYRCLDCGCTSQMGFHLKESK